MTNYQHLSAKLFLAFFSLVGIALASVVLAANEDNVGGFAWSENIGWISFNNGTVGGVSGGGGGKEYGVGINQSTGEMSGFAWSENIGWISFNSADVAGCPSGTCAATVDTATRYLSGWARAISARDESSNSGGWDGFIKLNGSYIDTNGDFHGWLTSSADVTTGVVGWVNLNSANCNGSNCTANGPYKVHTSATFGPTAAMECNGSCSGGDCHAFSNSAPWVMYAPTGDCPTCTFAVSNTSIPVASINCTNWRLVDKNTGALVQDLGTYGGPQSLTFNSGVATGTYKLKLTVSSTPKDSNDNQCSLGMTSTVEHEIEIKKEADADFMCSLDDPSVVADPVWLDCESASFKKKVMKGEKIFVKDSSTLSKYSEESEGASQINSRDWSFTIDGSTVDGGTGEAASFSAGKSNILKLEVNDNASRSNCQIINFNGKSLPKWQEVNPVSMIIDNLYADISKLFTDIAQ